MSNVDIGLSKGDILEADTEAIVCPANSRFLMSGGLARRLARAGGVAIEEEATKRGPAPPGLCVPTSAGSLCFKYVLHAVICAMDFQTNHDRLRDATAGVLRCAEDLGLASVSFPPLGMELAGVDAASCADVMLHAFRRYAMARDEHSQPVRLRIVLPDQRVLRVFARVLGGLA